MDNRKNTILLTVIAVATLLVAVVGATFAYFSAQGGGTATNNIEVKTEAAASSSFSIDKNIAILANMGNFAQGTGKTQHDTMTGTVEFTAGTGEGAQTDFCYTAALAWNSATPSDFVDTGSAEDDLTLTVTKKTGWNGSGYDTTTTIWDNVDITTSDLRASFTNIPTATGGAEYTHKLSTTAGQLAKEQILVTVSFNYDPNNDQTDNAGKTLTGTLTFTKATCPSES